MILMIDNYDSFTYNLVQYFMSLRQPVEVFRNDAISLAEIKAMQPDAIVLSPGPGKPQDGGICLSVIRQYSGRIPILGVCLGHQCIGEAFGGRVTGAKKLMHGKTSAIEHNNDPLFTGIRSPFTAIRYHSLILEKASLPACFEVTARSDEGEIMAIRHLDHKSTVGIQFHPESILTPCGKRLLGNYLKYYCQ